MKTGKSSIDDQEYIQGIENSFGAWENGPHPELEKGVEKYIRTARKGRKISDRKDFYNYTENLARDNNIPEMGEDELDQFLHSSK